MGTRKEKSSVCGVKESLWCAECGGRENGGIAWEKEAGENSRVKGKRRFVRLMVEVMRHESPLPQEMFMLSRVVPA